jgi:epoxyqueuosine reductase
MTMLAARIKDHARTLGFDLVGIAPATPADGFERLQQWLARGYAGEMNYMERHAEARRDPRSILPAVRSVVMVGLNYFPGKEKAQAGLGRIARYARGEDYHDVLRRKLRLLADWIEREAPGVRGRAVVDTAPLLERDFARRAGLGWFGKNTMLINKRLGSYFFLGALLLDIQLEADAPHETSHCGTCTACVEACPTGALPRPGELDARRCISYLTIELKGSITEELRTPMGDWLFGCDICQEVCPWNRKAPLATEPAFGDQDLSSLDPIMVLGLKEEAFRERFRKTALWRAGRRGLVRNAAIVLGNQGDSSALPALEGAAADPDPVIAAAARWAVAAIRERMSRRAPVSNRAEAPDLTAMPAG